MSRLGFKNRQTETQVKKKKCGNIWVTWPADMQQSFDGISETSAIYTLNTIVVAG